MNIQTQRYLQRANVSAYIREESEEQKAYSDLFDSILAKHGADSPNDLPDDKKDDFFNEVEREWAKHPKNKKDDGENTNEEWDKEDDEEDKKKMKEGWGKKKKKMKEEMEDEEEDEEDESPFSEGWVGRLISARMQMMNEARMVPNNTETPYPSVPTSSQSWNSIPMAQTAMQAGDDGTPPVRGLEGLPPNWMDRTLRFFGPEVIPFILERIRDMNPSDAFDWWWKNFGHFGGPLNEARRMGPPGLLPMLPDTGGPTPPETPGSGQPGLINPTGAPWGPQQWGPDHPGNPANWPDGHFGGPGKRWFIPIGGPDVVWPDNWGEEDQPPYPPSYIPVHPEHGYPLPGAWEWNGDTWVWNEDGQGSPNEPMDQEPDDGWYPQWGPRPEDRIPPIDQYYGPIPGGYQTGPFDY